MRHVARILVFAVTASIVTLPLARAQEQNGPSTPPQSHAQQHQGAVPPNSPRDSTSRRDQSAEVPQSPAVIPPPATGDKSVITPPASGAAKMPVIKPPGTSDNNEDVQPK